MNMQIFFIAMNVQVYSPSPRLKSVVLRYDFIEVNNALPKGHEIYILPNFLNGLIFFFYEKRPMRLRNSQMKEKDLPTASVFPGLSIPSYNLRVEPMRAIRIMLRPGQLWRLYGIPNDKMINTLIDIRGLLDHELTQLYEELANNIDINLNIQLIEKYLLNRLKVSLKFNDVFSALDKYFTNNGYCDSVKNIAKELGLSDRHLLRLVKEEIGFTVSEVRNIHRFNRAVNQLYNAPKFSLTGLAYDLDYSSQSHFNREFKRKSDCSPRTFLKKIGRENIIIPELNWPDS